MQDFSSNTSGVLTPAGYGSVALDGGHAVITDPGAGATGPYTQFGGYTSEFVDGQTASIDIYLDTSWSADESFQYTVAANDQNGVFMRDYGFQVRAVGDGTIDVWVSNGATQSALTSSPPDAISLDASGWYTFEHVFRDDNGVLAVDMYVIDQDGVATLVGTLSDPSDVIATEVGGVRYGWFTDISTPNGELMVDNISLGDYEGQIVEAIEGPGEDTTTYDTSGVIKFTDVDADDVHTVQVATPVGAVGTFNAVVSNTSAGDGEGAVTWTYTVDNAEIDHLAEGEVLTQTYTIILDDGNGGTASQTVTVTITGTNDAPIVTDDTAATTATDNGVAVTGNVLTNDSDVDSTDTLTVSNPGTYVGTYGTLTLNADGSYSYVVTDQSLSAADTGLVDTFTIDVTDGTATEQSTLTLNVNGQNDAPVASDDTATATATDNGAAVTGNVLTNDSDVDGDTLTVSNPGTYVGSYGTLTLNANGTYSYLVTDQSLGATDTGLVETFNVKVTDGAATDQSTLKINVRGQNDAPVAVDDKPAATATDNGLAVKGNVLTNDSDIDGDTLVVANAGTIIGTYGTLKINANGSYTYVVTDETLGAKDTGLFDTFNINVADGAATDQSTLTIKVNGQNDAPVVSIADQAVVAEGWVQASTILSTTDADGDAVTWYKLWDSEGGNNWWVPGKGFVDASGGYWVTAEEMSNVWFQGDASPSTQTLWVQAFDTEAGPWDSFTVRTYDNTPPVVSIEDQTVHTNGWVQASTVMTTTDADGDAATWYRLWDSEGGNNWWVPGKGFVDASAGYWVTAEEMADVWFQADAVSSTQTLWVQAFDTQAGAWDSFTLNSTNSAPVASIDDQTIETNGWIQANSVLTTTDADGDAVTWYKLWDSAGGDNWWVPGKGIVDASAGYWVTAEEMSNVWLQGDSSASTQTLYIQAFDSQAGGWDPFQLTTV